MRRRLFFPGPTQIPKSVKLPAPDVGYDINVSRFVRAENQRAMALNPRADSDLQPFGYPRADLPATLRGSHMALAISMQSIDMKLRHVGNPEAGIDRDSNEVGKILPGPLVSVIGGLAFRLIMMHVARPADWDLPVLVVARIEHALDFFVSEGKTLFLVVGRFSFDCLNQFRRVFRYPSVRNAEVEKRLYNVHVFR